MEEAIIYISFAYGQKKGRLCGGYGVVEIERNKGAGKHLLDPAATYSPVS